MDYCKCILKGVPSPFNIAYKKPKLISYNWSRADLLQSYEQNTWSYILKQVYDSQVNNCRFRLSISELKSEKKKGLALMI